MTEISIYQAAVTGILQGIGEFLPISSSAHLVIAPWIFGWEYQGLAYDVMLHLGTLLALAAVFWREWTGILVSGISKPSSADGRMLWLLAAGTVPAALAGYFLEHAAEHVFRSPLLIAINLAVFAGLLYAADKKFGGILNYKSLSIYDILIIGAAQSLAILPGASRSGITITAALLLGYKREEAAKISFLLSAPIIFGAVILEAKKLSFYSIDPAFITGFLFSFLSGWLSIKFLLHYIKTKPFNIFVIYRILLAGFIIVKVIFF